MAAAAADEEKAKGKVDAEVEVEVGGEVPVADDVVRAVLDRLEDVADLARARLVCSQWNRLVLTGRWPQAQELTVSKYSPATRAAVEWAAAQAGIQCCCFAGCTWLDTSLLFPLSKCMNLRQLCLRGLWNIDMDQLVRQVIVPAGKDITFLDLSSAPLTDLSACAMAKACGSLRTLVLDQCSAVTNVALMHIAEYCCELDTLSLRGLSQITNDGLTVIAHKLWRTLRVLRIAGCRAVQWITPVVKQLAFLEELDVSGTAVSEADIIVMSRTAVSLTRLNLSNCSQIGPYTITFLLINLALKLVSLNISGLLRLTDQTFQSLNDYWHGKSITLASGQHSDLRGVRSRVGEETIEGNKEYALASVADASIKDNLLSFPLEELDVSGCNIGDQALCLFVTHFPRLRRLSLAGCRNVSELALDVASHRLSRGLWMNLTAVSVADVSALRYASAQPFLKALLAASGKTIRELCLDQCHVADDIAQLIATACPRIERISLVACRGLSDIGIRDIASCRHLRDVRIGGSVTNWTDKALCHFSGLTSLSVVRRPFLRDDDIELIAASNPDLRKLSLAGCFGLTDISLNSMVHHCKGLEHLSLACCKGVRGVPLSRLQRLQSLNVSGCDEVKSNVFQMIAAACIRLTEIELPTPGMKLQLPVQAPGSGHLQGIRIEQLLGRGLVGDDWLRIQSLTGCGHS
eukprot:jgi/Chlat1/6136/Chrsp41S05691